MVFNQGQPDYVAVHFLVFLCVFESLLSVVITSVINSLSSQCPVMSCVEWDVNCIHSLTTTDY